MSTLYQRINDLLRDSGPPMEMIVEEVDNDEYLLQKAEAELREAQERVNQLRQKLAQKVPNTSTQ